jgi:hypothetical protein
MASDFSVAWQCLSKRTIGFLLRIKLHAKKNTFKKGLWWRGIVYKRLRCLWVMVSGKKGVNFKFTRVLKEKSTCKYYAYIV